MSETTPRDRAWLSVIESLKHGHDVRTRDIVDDADVSDQTARAVLRVAEDAGLFHRESPRAQTWMVDIGPLADVDDDGYRRAIQTLIAEGNL